MSLYVRMHWRECLHWTDTEDTGIPLRSHALERIPPQNRHERMQACLNVCMGWKEFLHQTDKEDTGMSLYVRMSWREFLHRTDKEDTEHALASP